jgi:chitinase
MVGDLGYANVDQFKADIATVHGQGRKVIISVGGQNGHITVNDATTAANFANSTVALMNSYGFAGVDIDVENAINPQWMATALHQIAAQKPGAIITMAPETLFMLNAQSTYLDLAVRVKDILTMVNTQYYNSGSMLDCNGATVQPGTVDFMTGMICTAIQAGLRPDQLGVGLPATPAAAGSGYVDPSVVNNALNCLAKGTNCGSFRPPAGNWPTIRGAMTWSINYDATNNYNWAKTVKANLNTLP